MGASTTVISTSNDVSRPGLDRFMDLMARFADVHMRPWIFAEAPAVKSVRPAEAEGKKPRLDGGGAGVGLSAEVETQAMTVSQANVPSSSAAHRSKRRKRIFCDGHHFWPKLAERFPRSGFAWALSTGAALHVRPRPRLILSREEWQRKYGQNPMLDMGSGGDRAAREPAIS
jgi:hypothetical protein